MVSIFKKSKPKYIPKVFNEDPNEEGIPFLVKTYRKFNNGKNQDKLQDLFMYSSSQGMDNMQSNLFKLQFAEPIAKGLIGFEPDILSYVFSDLLHSYSISGVIGQIKNIEELINYFPEYSYAKKYVEEAYLEIKAKDEILKIIKEEGPILKKDLLPRLQYYPKLYLQENFLFRLLTQKVIQTRKRGKFVEYFV